MDQRKTIKQKACFMLEYYRNHLFIIYFKDEGNKEVYVFILLNYFTTMVHKPNKLVKYYPKILHVKYIVRKICSINIHPRGKYIESIHSKEMD